MSELTYTALSDGFKIAKNDDGNVVFARNGTSLFVADPTELNTALSLLIGSTSAQAVVDTTTANALAAANDAIALQAKQIGSLQDQLAAEKVTSADAVAAAIAKIAALDAQIAADQKAAALIQATIEAANTGAEEASIKAETPAAQGEPQEVGGGGAPTIAPSNTGISGS
jgi:hypothetical protein